MNNPSPGARPTAPSGNQTGARLSARLPDLRQQSLAAIHLVMSLRFCAMAEAAGREPLAALSCRMGSVTAARAVLTLTEAITRAWPERFTTARPCCTGMTPDEWTAATMTAAARRGDRAGFSAILDGFVRTDRHDSLFGATVNAMAAIEALP